MTIEPERLRLGIELLGISRGELASASQVSPTTISLFLSGRRTISREIAMRLILGLEKPFKMRSGRFDNCFFRKQA